MALPAARPRSGGEPAEAVKTLAVLALVMSALMLLAVLVLGHLEARRERERRGR